MSLGITWWSPVQFLAEFVLGDLHRTILPVLLAGGLGGLIGFAYLTALRLLELVLRPDHGGPWLQLGILAGVGLAVGVIKRFHGNPGEMELLVDNIHVLGTTVVVTEMAGLPLRPTTLVAAIVSLLLTSEVGLIHTQRKRGAALNHA